jgi:hypothetical protein
MMDEKVAERAEEYNSGASSVSSASVASDSGSKPSSSRKIVSTRSTQRTRMSRRSSIPSHLKHYVEHNYHDHVHDPPETDLNASNNTLKKHRGGHRGGVAVPFPEKLHYMLSRMDQEGTTNVVAWQGHGRCFIVKKPKEFVEEIMPR